MIDCPIDGVLIRQVTKHSDRRGWLMEVFRQDELDRDIHPVMSYVSMTRPGTTRGPHEHRFQTDMFAFVGPATFRLFLWDNRPESATRGETFQVDVGEDRPTVVVVPPGVVHGYRNVGEVDGYVYNAPNELYAGENRAGEVDEIRHEDDPNSPFKIPD